MKITLNAKKREANAKVLDTELKAVVYGPKEGSYAITIPSGDFVKAYNKQGETGLIELDFGDRKVNALVHEIQLHAVKNSLIHADFYAVEMDKKTHAHVPLVFSGDSQAVREGALLVKVLHEVEVEALPADLPHDLTVDISKLVTLTDSVHAKDVTLPSGVTLLTDSEDVVASVVLPEEEKETAPVDLSAIELSTEKGKKEEVAE